MAKRMFDVPIALVSLIDEKRQWFKSSQGLPAKETHRDISFCGHAILGEGGFIIPDTLLDERFFDNPLVTDEPKIRFYAGCPLQAPNGSKLGTLCIIDKKPKQLGADDMQALRDLATTVERELCALQMATVDELTNISNRRGFMMLAEHLISVAIRNEKPVTLIYFDLDKFKAINDTYGHSEGDNALIAFANQMKSACRESDAFARLGGDEFAVLLTDTSTALAEVFIKRFSESLASLNNASDASYEISFSSGMVLFDVEKHPTLEDFLKDADQLMFDEK